MNHMVHDIFICCPTSPSRRCDNFCAASLVPTFSSGTGGTSQMAQARESQQGDDHAEEVREEKGADLRDNAAAWHTA